MALLTPVRVDGGLANDPALTDHKRDLKCGKYAYWAGWLPLNRRTTSEGAAVDALHGGLFYVADAGSQRPQSGTIPTGAFWASDEEMCCQQERGSAVRLLWKAGAHPAVPGTP